jgi:hypothetical protein
MAKTDSNGGSFFARYIDAPKKEQSVSPKIQHAQKLLEWLLRWPKPIVRGKDVRIYGPRPRDRKSMLDAADVLVRHGWLSPIQSRRYDGHTWQIIRKPIIPPKVSQVAD